MFPSPVVADAGGGRVSLTAPLVQYTFDDRQDRPSRSSGHVDVNTDGTRDAAFQELGLASSPVRLDYTGVTFRGSSSRSS